MENAHAMMQAIMQAVIEAMKATVQAMSEVAGPAEKNSAAAAIPSMNTRNKGTAMKQPPFKWKAQDK